MAPPDAVADHHHARRIGHVIFGTKRPSERGNDAEHREVLVRGLLARDRLWLALIDQGRPPPGHHRDFLEERVLASPVGVVPRSGPLIGGAAACPHVLPHSDQPIGVTVGQRPQQQGVDHGEDRGVGANPERQRQDGDDGEGRRFPQHPDGVADVLKHLTQHGILGRIVRS